MAREVKLSQLKKMCRLYADERPGGAQAFIDEDELRDLINSAIADEYDLFIHAGGHERYETIVQDLTVADTATIDLPDDFYELISLHLGWGYTLVDDGGGGFVIGSMGQVERVEALDSVDDRQDITNYGVWAREGGKCYRRRASLIEFFPTPNAVTAYELRYIPTAPVLTAEDDTFDGVNGWERMIEYRVAGEILAIAGRSPQPMLALAQAEREKIEIIAHQATASSPDRVRDVRYSNNRRNWRRLGPVPPGST